MIITRWQAKILPTVEQIKLLLINEGLEPSEESLAPTHKIQEHRHSFCEIRVVASGELQFNIAGNKFILRAGDRLEIPANTKHSHSTLGSENCICICANRAI